MVEAVVQILDKRAQPSAWGTAGRNRPDAGR